MAKFTTIIYVLLLIGTAIAIPINANQSETKTFPTDEELRHLNVQADFDLREIFKTIRDAFKDTLKWILGSVPQQIPVPWPVLQINTPTETEANKPEMNKPTEIKPDAATIDGQKRYLSNILNQQTHRNSRDIKTDDIAIFINEIQNDVMRMINSNRETVKYAEYFKRNNVNNDCSAIPSTVFDLGIKLAELNFAINACLEPRYDDFSRDYQTQIISDGSCDHLKTAFKDATDTFLDILVKYTSCLRFYLNFSIDDDIHSYDNLIIYDPDT